MKQQLRFVGQAEKRIEQKRMILLDAQKRLKAVESIMKQRALQQAAAEARRERQETDEQAAIRYLNQSGMDGEMARALMLDEESYVA